MPLHNAPSHRVLQADLALPCGEVLKNRIAKSPMSDSLADGAGNPTATQIRLYERWALGGAALSMVGEVQGDARFPEKPGNLVLGAHSDQAMLRRLTRRATVEGAGLWAQLGHAGALAHAPISRPVGPSALDLPGLRCAAMTADALRDLPAMYARAASLAKTVGFSGVHVHAGHGFLLSQFLSPLFNRRRDGYGGSIEARCRIVLEVVRSVRQAVGPSFPLGIRINATDNLDGGLSEDDALEVVGMLDRSAIDLIDISGGTYFPGARASSDGTGRGPYFLGFARRARERTRVPLMLTGGFKRREQAVDAIAGGAVDMVGLARAMVLDPQIANRWLDASGGDPEFPAFASPVIPGGITAWYTMRLTALGEDREHLFDLDLPAAMHAYEDRDAQRCVRWLKTFSPPDQRG